MKKDWFTLLSAIGWFCLFCALMLMLALSLIGCESSPPLSASSVQITEEEVHFEDEWGTGTPLLTVMGDGRVGLAAVVSGNRCGTFLGFPPREAELGPLLELSVGYAGTYFGSLAVGDTLGGSFVVLGDLDSVAVEGGRFLATVVAPDTLDVVAYLRVPSLSPCNRDSLVYRGRCVRSHAEAP